LIKTQSFIDKAVVKHGSTYDYSKVDYVDSKTKVIIICKEHGEFRQKTYVHLYGHGCSKCSKENKRSNTQEFIKKSHILYDHKYDYSLVEYRGSQEKVIIVCKEHGEFHQTPNNHLRGGKCYHCTTEHNNKVRVARFTKQFHELAQKVHGREYDYSEYIYVNTKTKGKIICSLHGPFMQTPDCHITKKAGCRTCAHNLAAARNGIKLYYNKPTVLYKVKILHNDVVYWKIGITTKTKRPLDRFHKTEDVTVSDLIYYKTGEEAYTKEQELLFRYRDFKYLGENIIKSGNSELFTKEVFL